MNLNKLIHTHPYSKHCTAFEANLMPLWQDDGFPLHLPHALPGPILSVDQAKMGDGWPVPAIGIAFELNELQVAVASPLPVPLWPVDDAIHTLNLNLPVEETTLEIRAAVLHELSELLCGLTHRGETAFFVAISQATSMYRSAVYRHVPVGIFDSFSGEALWIHPAAEAFDLIRSPFPASQWARRLGESVLGREWKEEEDFSDVPLLDPATGLPGWASLMRANLEHGDPDKKVLLTEVAEAIAQGIWASDAADSVDQARLAAMGQIASAQALFFGEPPARLMAPRIPLPSC